MDELQERAARISTVLESNWSEDFGGSLADEQEAANGFALARALSQGWIEPSPSLSEAFDAAETFIDDMGEAEDDTGE